MWLWCVGICFGTPSTFFYLTTLWYKFRFQVRVGGIEVFPSFLLGNILNHLQWWGCPPHMPCEQGRTQAITIPFHILYQWPLFSIENNRPPQPWIMWMGLVLCFFLFSFILAENNGYPMTPKMHDSY